MKIEISTYEYEKVITNTETVDLPEVPSYYFETGVRRAIRMIPVWTTWNEGEEEIYKYTLTFVYQSRNRIEEHEFHISELKEFHSKKESLVKSFIESLSKGWLNIRTKSQFDADMEATLDWINQNVGDYVPNRELRAQIQENDNLLIQLSDKYNIPYLEVRKVMDENKRLIDIFSN